MLAVQVWIGITISEPASEPLAEKCVPLLRDLELNYELGLALLVTGIAAEYRSEFREAIGILEESLGFLGELDDPLATTDCLTWLGWAYYELGDLDQAYKCFSDSYEVAIAAGNIIGLPYALSKLGTWADAREEYERGAAYHQDALKYFKAIDDQAGQGYALSRVSLSAWGMKDYKQALQYGKAGYKQFEAIGHRWGMATTISRIGFAELALGQYDKAESHFYDGLFRALDYAYPATANYALIGLAKLWAEQGEIERAAELLVMILESPKNAHLYRVIGRQALTEIEEQLPSDVFAGIQEQASGKNLQEAIDEIRKEHLPASAPSIPLP